MVESHSRGVGRQNSVADQVASDSSETAEGVRHSYKRLPQAFSQIWSDKAFNVFTFCFVICFCFGSFCRGIRDVADSSGRIAQVYNVRAIESSPTTGRY